MDYKSNKKINDDQVFYGLKFRTRSRYHDENIIKDVLCNNPYRLPDNPKVVVDIGANVGSFSLAAARNGAQLVYAFEPEQYNYETLCYNVTVNGFDNIIHCVNNGVGRRGKTKLYVHHKNSGATSAYLEQTGLDENRTQEVDFITINNVFDLYDIKYCDILKLDCEGSEREIINDFDDNLAVRVGQVSLEFHRKDLVPQLVDKLKRWYDAENTRRYEWIFKKKI